MNSDTRRNKIECKPELVISSLQRFYSTRHDIDKVLQYLNGDAPLSLRIIDWFVTKYSRKCFIRYPLNGHDFLVYLSYKGQLKAYSKQYFDPNCRRERIMFKIPGHEQFMTTIGKLNFFRWALESNILDYIKEHEDVIRTGYNTYLKETTQTQKRNKNDSVSSISSNSSNESVSSNMSIASVASASSVDSSLSMMSLTSSNSATSSTTTTSTGSSTNNDYDNYKMDIRGARTTRRRTKQTPSSLNRVQMCSMPVELVFD
jgi:hypothetical protein